MPERLSMTVFHPARWKKCGLGAAGYELVPPGKSTGCSSCTRTPSAVAAFTIVLPTELHARADSSLGFKNSRSTRSH